MSRLLALDLSLTATGVVTVGSDWDMRPERVRGWTLGTKAGRPLAERIDALARDVLALARYVRATAVWCEEMPRGTLRGHDLVELRAAVRLELWRARLPELGVWWAPTARTLLYGAQPPRGLSDRERKAWLYEPLKLAGLPLDDDNQGDAFAGANLWLSELGAPCLAGLCAPPKREFELTVTTGVTLTTGELRERPKLHTVKAVKGGWLVNGKRVTPTTVGVGGRGGPGVPWRWTYHGALTGGEEVELEQGDWPEHLGAQIGSQKREAAE